MLTKDLQCTKVVSGRLIPTFLRDSEEWLTDLNVYLETAQQNVGCNILAFRESLLPYTHCNSWKSRVYKALTYILEKDITYQEAQDGLFEQRRQQAFDFSTQFIAKTENIAYRDFSERLYQQAKVTQEELYQDLPHEKKIVQLPQLNAHDLIKRYNTLLMQSIFAQSEMIKLEIHSPDDQTIQYIKQHIKLLGLAYQESQVNETSWQVNLKGPLLIDKGQIRYRNDLCIFLDIVTQLKQYTCSAFIEHEHGKAWFGIDQKNKRFSHTYPIDHFIPYAFESLQQKLDQSLYKLGYRKLTNQLFHWESVNGTTYLDLYQYHQGDQLRSALNKASNKRIVFAIDRILEPVIQNSTLPYLCFNKMPSASAIVKLIQKALLDSKN